MLQGHPPKSDVNHRKTAPWRDTGQGRQVEERTPHCASNCKARSSVDRKKKTTKSDWVFAGDAPDRPILGTNLAHMHTKVCRPGKGKSRKNHFPSDFVLHSLRHTALTRLGEAGADAFTIMKLAGHSSVTVSQRYVHPTGETVQLTFDRLEALNNRALKATSGQ